ncbi:hypothetical protein NHX12_027409 [Muraenolepis orangiensis]|uniref:Uncharacterized protein n=1 Tax=Muraenolepis orangiensis TaxID=630683 RepID=A0A9Q0EC95_9TELE|nr:hypothetical protein NHX12_027409 [Muraenolepis orangiensis]
MVKVVNSVSDALNAMQKETVGLKARTKADLQRALVGARLKDCANGLLLLPLRNQMNENIDISWAVIVLLPW